MMDDDKADRDGSSGTDERRRAALAKLGLGVAAAYSAPVVLGLRTDAHAAGGDSPPYGNGGGYGPCSNPSQGSPPGGSSGQGQGCDVASAQGHSGQGGGNWQGQGGNGRRGGGWD